MKDFPSPYSLPYIAKAEAAPSIIMAALGFIITLLLAPQILKDLSTLPIPLLIGCLLDCFLWISAHQIHLLPDGVRYLTGIYSSELRYEDIIRLDMHYFRSVPMLDIWCLSSDRPLSVSTKPFSKRDMAITVDAIVSHNAAIEMNDLAQRLRRGDIP